MTIWDFVDKNIAIVVTAIIGVLLFIGIIIPLIISKFQMNVKIGKVSLKSKQWNQLSDFISKLVRLEIERATEHDHVRDDARRVIKNYVEQALIIMRQIEQDIRCKVNNTDSCTERDRVYELITAGPVKDYLVSEFMEIVERNGIAALSDSEFAIKNLKDFERIFMGTEAIIETVWIDDKFDVKHVKDAMRQNSHKFSSIFGSVMADVRTIAKRYAERRIEIANEIDALTKHT